MVKFIFRSVPLFIITLYSTAALAYMFTVYRINREKRGTLSALTPAAAQDVARAWDLYQKQNFSRFYFKYEPNVGVRVAGYSSEGTNVDAEGVRLSVQSGRLPESSVYFLGGSTVWGSGVADRSTIPSLVGAEGVPYKVVNWGMRGAGTRQELNLLLNNAEQLKKGDLVVFYDGVSDLDSGCLRGAAPHENMMSGIFRDFTDFADRKAFRNYDWENLFFYPLLRLREAYFRFRSERSWALGEFDCHLNREKAARVAGEIVANWRRARSEAHARGAGFVAVLQPTIFFQVPEKKWAIKIDASGLAEDYQVVYRLVRELMAKEPWFLDLSDLLKEDDQVFFDHCHMTPRGNGVAAKKIAEIIRPASVSTEDR